MSEGQAHDHVLAALDFALRKEWDQAKAALEPHEDATAGRLFLLIADLEHEEHVRERAHLHLRHEIGNALSIAQANIEGILDGVVPATPERLKNIHSSLTQASGLLEDLRRLR